MAKKSKKPKQQYKTVNFPVEYFEPVEEFCRKGKIKLGPWAGETCLDRVKKETSKRTQYITSDGKRYISSGGTLEQLKPNKD